MARRVPINRSQAIRRGDFNSVENQTRRQQEKGAQAFDRGEGETGAFAADEERISTRGRDASATGFGSRIFGTNRREWNPEVPYPQIEPSNTTNEERPRTIAMGYDPTNEIIRVTFRPNREGTAPIYEYYGVPEHVWESFSVNPSPGRFIDDFLNGYAYARKFELEG